MDILDANLVRLDVVRIYATQDRAKKLGCSELERLLPSDCADALADELSKRGTRVEIAHYLASRTGRW